MLVGEQREGERVTLQTTRKIFWLLAIVALIGWLYIILQSELLEIQEIQVEGAKMNDPMEIERGVYRILDREQGWHPWESRHIWFADPKELVQELKQTFYLEEVLVEKEGRHILRLKIKEYPHRLTIYKNQSFYWVDLRGQLDVELNKDERQQMLTRVYGKRVATQDEPPLIRVEKFELSTTTQDVFSPSRLKGFIGFTMDLQRLRLPYREFRIETPTSTKVVLVNEQGTPVYFELEPPEILEKQLQTYKAFWDTQKQIKGPQVYQYIDVRVPDMIYLR
jgi:cell division septal protein FtsQ